jgi:hypothetical protein
MGRLPMRDEGFEDIPERSVLYQVWRQRWWMVRRFFRRIPHAWRILMGQPIWLVVLEEGAIAAGSPEQICYCTTDEEAARSYERGEDDGRFSKRGLCIVREWVDCA